jgi:predicted  nucleic acid-binding Zn-ribbon protein
MSFINTIEDDSDQVELIVRQRLEAKPGCNIVGFDAYDQASAVTELSTQLSSNSSRIDGIVASLSNTDSNVVAFNSNLLAAIANTASNTVTNASLVSDLRSDVDSNSALTTNLQANTVAITADLASNSALVSGLRTDLDANSIRVSNVETDLSSNATLLSNATARISVVEFDLYDSNGTILSNVSNLNFDMYQANGLVSNLSSNLSNIESNLAEAFQLYSDAVSGNSQAQTTLITAGATVGAGAVLNVVGKIFGFAQQKANQAFADQTRTTVAEVFGSNNWDSITTSNGFSLTHNSNISSLQSQMALVRSHTDTTSARQIKINGNSSNITSLQSNTANLQSLLSNVQSELFTHDTLLALHSNELADNVLSINSLTSSLSDNSSRITQVSSDLASNSARITTVSDDLASNAARLSTLESSSGSSLFTTTITSQRANGQAAALYARDTNNPDRADNIEYNYVLNAPRPGTTTGGIDLFINSANRTDDGGASTATLRNGSGDFRLGNASYDTIIDGSEVVIPQGKSMKLTGNYLHSTAKLYIDRDGVQSWGSTTAYDAFRFFETRNSSGAESFNAVKIGAAGIAIGYDPPTYSNGGTVGFTCSKKVGIGTNSAHTLLHTQSNAGANNAWVDQWKHVFDTNWNFRISQQHNAGSSVPFAIKQRYNSTEYTPITFRGSSMELASNVGIGTDAPDVPLHVTATTSASVGDTHVWVTSSAKSGGYPSGVYDGGFGANISNQQYTYSIKSAGAVSSTRFILHSDERIKKDIVDVEDDEALVKLRMLHPKKYRFIDESAQGAHQVYGFLANEVQEVLPDAVVEHTNEDPIHLPVRKRHEFQCYHF